jgi:hypothetical protein
LYLNFGLCAGFIDSESRLFRFGWRRLGFRDADGARLNPGACSEKTVKSNFIENILGPWSKK